MRIRGFTMIECLVSVIIVTVIAGLALMGYTDMMVKQAEYQIFIDLKTIHTAIRIREAQQGTYDLCGAGCATAKLNSDLGLHLSPAPEVTYRCFYTVADGNRCRGEYLKGASYWEVTLWPAVSDDAYCSTGNNCPTCTAAGCNLL